MFNLQRAMYVPSFKNHLLSVALKVKQETVIFNQNPHIRVGQQNAYFTERDGLFWFKHSAKERIRRHCLLLSGKRRLSHANCEILKKSTNQAVRVIVSSGSLAVDKCTTCSEC